jgi:hypothetical protein
MKKSLILTAALAGAAAGAFAQVQPVTPRDVDFEVTQNKDGVTLTITDYKGSAKNITIPQTLYGLPVTVIGKEAFMKKGLTGVVIPEGVIAIEDGEYSNGIVGAFAGNQLTGVTIPNSVTTIGDNAFYSNKLTGVTIPDSVTRIGGQAFYSNQLTGVILGKGLTEIGWRAFSVNKLTSVTIPNNVTTIGDNAFSSNKLSGVTIPDSEIGGDGILRQSVDQHHHLGRCGIYQHRHWV